MKHVVLVSAVSWLVFCTETCLAGQIIASVFVHLGDGTSIFASDNVVGDDPIVALSETTNYTLNPGTINEGSATTTSTAIGGRGHLGAAVLVAVSTAQFGLANADGLAEATYASSFTLAARDLNGDLLPGNISWQAHFSYSGAVVASNSSPPGIDTSRARTDIFATLSGGGFSASVNEFREVTTFTDPLVTGNPIAPFTVNVEMPNNTVVSLNMGIALDALVGAGGGGSGIATASFTDSLFWNGITNVQHTGGLEIASFSALGEGFDWVNPVPEPSTFVLASLGLLAVGRGSRRRPRDPS